MYGCSFILFLLSLKERKRVLEAERQARVEELLIRRKEQEARIEQQRQEKEKAREDAARERARFVLLNFFSLGVYSNYLFIFIFIIIIFKVLYMTKH